MNTEDYNVLFSKVNFYNIKSFQNKVNFDDNNIKNEVFLCNAYRKIGNKLPSQLNGEFSFVLFDSMNDIYFCARDPLGIQPLYYTKIEKEYKFSSTIEELLNHPEVIKKPNLKTMSTALNQHTIEYEDTMYETIFRLPPAHFMVIKNGQKYIERYWFPEKIKINYTITEEEAAIKLKELFLQAVEKRISNLKETAFEVSGGLDSSSVVSLLAQKTISETIDSYSMDFTGMKCDEGEYVDSILEQYPLHHQKIPVGHLDYEKSYSLEKLYDISPNWPITLTFAMIVPMIEKMKKDGKKVIITGQGGDHLFTGTPYSLHDLFRRFKFLDLYRELQFYPKPWRTIRAYIIRPLLGEKVTEFIKIFLGKYKTDMYYREKNKILNLSQKIKLKNPAFKIDLDALTSAGQSAINDSGFFHCAENYYGIEYRHPFFDIDLVEFALSLPPEMKYQRRTIKWILRKAMDGILPDKIRDRKDKAEFSEVLMQQIDTIDLARLLDDAYIVKLGMIEQIEIDNYRQEYENKTLKYVSTLWILINVEYWYRYNFENESLIDLNSE